MPQGAVGAVLALQEVGEPLVVPALSGMVGQVDHILPMAWAERGEALVALPRIPPVVVVFSPVLQGPVLITVWGGRLTALLLLIPVVVAGRLVMDRVQVQVVSPSSVTPWVTPPPVPHRR